MIILIIIIIISLSCMLFYVVCNKNDLHSWHKCESAATNSVLSIPRCNLLFRHWRTVQVYNRPKLGDVRLKPSWEQRISWWSSTIKRLPYVNRANPLWKRRVMPVWFHAQSTHWKWFSGQQTPCLNCYGGQILCKKSTTNTKSLFLQNVLSHRFHFSISLDSCSMSADGYYWLFILLQYCVKHLQHTAIYR